jgi:predicted DCC family thiol-disulfide oxidoreductase YuxK
MDSGTLPILVYDGDCGFCTRWVTVLQRRMRAFPNAQPWQRLDLTALGLTEPQVREAVQWVGRDGTQRSGARVASELLRYQPSRTLRVLGALCDTAVVRPVAAVLYRWVAAHRYQLPGGTAACHVEAPHPEPTADA